VALKAIRLRAVSPIEETKRPFRLWDSEKKETIPHAYYKNLRRCHMRALYEAAWSKGNTVVEVIDIRTGSLRGQYKRVGKHIEFWRSSHNVDTTE